MEVLISGSGLYWMGAGAVLTFVPLIVVGLLARKVFKLDLSRLLCGVLAGSMTDPPALAFATNITKSDQPLVAYAAVYPLGHDPPRFHRPDFGVGQRRESGGENGLEGERVGVSARGGLA